MTSSSLYSRVILYSYVLLLPIQNAVLKILFDDDFFSTNLTSEFQGWYIDKIKKKCI